MKRYLLMAGFALGLTACGDNNSNHASHTAADSSGHSEHAANSTANPASSMSMMDMMNKNMQDMKAVQSTGNPDNDFAALMKVHHMGALEMAQAEIANGTNAELKAMAQKMVDAQQQEIAELNTFLSGHEAHGGGDSFYKEVMSQMNNMKMDMDHSGSVDKQFAQMMIPHHQGAIDMAKAYLKAGAHEEKLKTMANKIIADQQKEIAQLQTWLKNNQ
jgi:uncharacterized protein (DUF305 family)